MDEKKDGTLAVRSNDGLSPSNLVLIEQARLCCHVELPKSFSEMNTLLWKAFNLGKEYRDKGGTD
jgi:hypothetical protein